MIEGSLESKEFSKDHILLLLFRLRMHILTLCADVSIGRFDSEMLSDQTRMEVLITAIGDPVPLPDDADLDGRYEFTDMDGNYLDKCDWHGVACNDEGDVTRIDWHETFWTHGTVSLDYLPRSLERFRASNYPYCGALLYGTLSTALLPPDLQKFHLEMYEFSGSVDIGALPESLEVFSIQNNKFFGSIDLTALPKKLRKLFLAQNKLSGSLNFEKLPESLTWADLSFNAFQGTINLKALPAALRELSMVRNNLCGELDMGSIPAGLEVLDVRSNAFRPVNLEYKSEELKFFWRSS